jgi:hypothetical protein
MYYYQFVAFLTILKITAFLMIFWNVFIHSHREWAVKCRKERRNFWNRTIITIIQKIQYFSIHMWLKLLYGLTLSQYDCIPSLTAVKMLDIFMKQILSSKRISTCRIISSIWILVKFWYSISTRKVIMFLAKHNIQWWDEWLVISQMFLFAISSISVSRITKALCNVKLLH